MPKSILKRYPFKRKSITMRLTLFYSIALSLLIIALFFFLYSFMERSTDNLSKPILEDAVMEVVNEIYFENNALYIDKDDINLYKDGVSIVLYHSDMDKFLGTMPQGFPSGIPMQNDHHRSINGSDGVQWNIYDVFYHGGQNGVWVRGIYSMDSAKLFLRNTLLALMIAFPLFILIVLIAGYLITKRTLTPLEDLTQAVSAIKDSKDLNRRLPIKPTDDKINEIEILTLTFNEMLDRLQKQFLAEQQFTSDASHELRTPVAAIMAQADAGLMKSASLEDKNDALNRIHSQSKNMNTLLNQLLELTRADRGTLKLDLEDIDLSELADVVWESMLDMASKYDITLQKQIDNNIHVTGDEVLLMRLIINLVSNGIKYGHTGGYVSINVREDEAYAILSVTDNGIGLSEEDSERIFDRFYRVSKDRSKRSNQTEDYSSGLGLSMVKWIVDVHQGTIEVHSTEKVGSQFIVRLPLQKS